MGAMCASSTQVINIDGNKMARYDSSWDSHRKLMITIPIAFNALGESGDGELHYQEFTTGFGFDSTPLTRKLFEAFDADNSGKINLVEFVAGLRNWKMFTYEEKMKFTYKIYDLDGSGFVEPHELAECLADSNAGWRDKGAMQQIVRKILKYLEMADLNRVKLSDFTTLAKKFPSSLFLPLFGLMEKIFTVVEIHDDEASMPSVM